jgi:23S rRNA (guanosine2251-2'-O)-methyltransferase
VKVDRVSRATLDKLAGGTRHQGVATYAPPLELLPLERAMQGIAPVVLALDEVQDPQNFGAMVRSAIAIADATVLFAEHGAAPLTPSTFRASAGAIEHARLVRVSSLRAALAKCVERGMAVVALDGHADRVLADVDLTGPSVLVIGSEGKGVRKTVRAVCSAVARLPMSGRIDSLNASAAAAVALYEVVRQRSENSQGSVGISEWVDESAL